MAGEQQSTVYTDRLDFPSTLMFMLQQMTVEAARDGFEREFEDLVDLMVYCLTPLLREDELLELVGIDADGAELRHDVHREAYGKAKRKRIRGKLLLAVKVMQRNKLLLKHVEESKWDFDPNSYPVREPDG